MGTEPPPSVTAVISALMRAAHLHFDEEPKIFRDPLAMVLAGIDSEDELRASLEGVREAMASDVGPERADLVLRYLRSVMSTRSRYTEDELARALREGTRQYVVLGAGLDSFAYRSMEADAQGLRIFELDLPSTQRAKRTRLRELGIEEPENLTFVPADLERESLLGSLPDHGFLVAERAFFSWLGTTQYLVEHAVLSTLSQLASLSPGTEVVFQYQLSEHLLSEPDRIVFEVISDRARRSGEPWLTTFEPDVLAARVKQAGFSEAEDFGPEDADARYFGDRNDGLSAPGLSHIMKARV
jgi:methyltransferase (TIGR00027 family)